MGYPGPFSPEELEAANAYYGGGMSVAPVAPVASSAADYYGPPVAPPNATVDPTVHAYPEATPREIAQPLDPRSLPYQPNPGAPGYNPNPGAPLPGGKGMLAPIASLESAPAGKTPTPAGPTPALPFGPPKELAQDPGGPTAKDDREFEALLALQKAKKPSGGGSAGGGASAPVNRDPYGILDSYRMQGEGIQMQTDAERERASRRGEMMATAARHREEDAKIAEAEAVEAERRFNEMQADAQKQLDAVREKKIDPDRLMKSDGMAFSAMIGGLFGGIYMGLNKLSSNPFIDDLNKRIDRDIAAQEKNIDHARAGAVDKMNLIRDQRAMWKDSQMAKLQARSLTYEAVAQKIDAEMAKYDDPISQARGAQAIAAIQREQGQVQKALDEERRRLAMAGASAQMADVKAKRAAFMETYKEGIAHGLPPAQAEAEATRMLAILYGGGAPPREPTQGGGDPLTNVPKNQQEAAQKELSARAEATKGAEALEQAYAAFREADVVAGGRDAWKATVRGILKPHMKGANSDADLDQLINPLVPTTGEPESQSRGKLMAAKALITSQIATPTLDRYAPGHAGPKAPQQYGTDGKPLKR